MLDLISVLIGVGLLAGVLFLCIGVWMAFKLFTRPRPPKPEVPYSVKEMMEVKSVLDGIISTYTLSYIQELYGKSDNGEILIDDDFMQRLIASVGKKIFKITSENTLNIFGKYMDVDIYIREQIMETLKKTTNANTAINFTYRSEEGE